jgi:hypothetical protein
MDPWLIAVNYIKGWFTLDITLVISEVLVTALKSNGPGFLRFGRGVSRGMRVVRMIRLVKLRRIMADIMDRIPSEYARTVLRVLKLLMFIIMLNHYIACGWYWLGTSQESEHNMTWVRYQQTVHQETSDGSVWYFYTTSLHWSLTQFTPASMEVYPTNKVERTYSVCVLMFALVTFSSFVSTITSSVTHLQHINARRLHNQVLLRRYLSERRISAALVLRVCHYSQIYQRSQGGMERKTSEDKVEALKILPSSMRQEIRWEAHSPAVLAHPFFFQYNVASPSACKEVCAQAISEVSLVVGQELFTQTKAVKQMVFVLEGSLTYSYPANLFAMHKESVGKHMWACELAMWAERVDLYGPFAASCCCGVLLLSVSEFHSIAKSFPSSFLGAACYAERFIEHATEVAKDNRWKTVLCNSFDLVHEMAHLSFDLDLRPSRRSSRCSLGSVEDADMELPSRLTETEEEWRKSSSTAGRRSSWMKLKGRRSSTGSIPTTQESSQDPVMRLVVPAINEPA